MVEETNRRVELVSRTNLIRSLLTWLDIAYILPKGLDSIRTLGLKAFEERVITGNPSIHGKLAPCIAEWLKLERIQGIPSEAHRPTIISLVEMLQTLGIYSTEFHTPYVLATQEFYKQESLAFSSNPLLTPVQFLEHCISRLGQELQRCHDILPAECLHDIEQATERSLLHGRIDWIVETGVPSLIESKNAEGLRKLYDLLNKVDALERLKSAFSKSIEETVSKIVLIRIEQEEEMIPQLLAFKSFIDDVLVSAFKEEAKIQHDEPSGSAGLDKPRRGRGPFGYAATDAFAKGFGKRSRKPAEMIAKFIDKAMRKGQKGGTDEEFNAKLDAVLSLYQFTKDRDVFRTFYYRALAKRLLLQRSASDDFEKAVIKKLREGYDPEFGKGDEMFKDLALSRDLSEEFHYRHPEDRSVSIMVLQYSCWPYQPKGGSDIDLPSQMLGSLERFSAFYTSKHKQRKLDWFHSLGTVALNAKFSAGEKELSVSLYQAAVLLLFNDADKLGFNDIKQQTNMGEDDLRITLQSLACGKKRVLKKIPVGRDVNNTDTFVYNAEFTDSSRKIHINSIQVKVSVEESKATDERVQEDRVFMLDAAIVRLMKAKKRMANGALLNETIIAVKGHFQPNVGMIKKQIESLIDREYIRRDDNEANIYHYVA
ncbi:hypothetical protein M422DRAFT_57384 [Sphaerobolus stellatus SS14]|nr:hypothetical protein M422DRAFT_57384 [Sphaerobolus stellatus SS14]